MLLKKTKLKDQTSIQITGSKSISNRLLILSYLFDNIDLINLSNSQDTTLLKKALDSKEDIIDIHHAGTAMRFLTAYLSIQNGRETIITGSDRMKQRPIKPLVEALRNLGADITYLENEGFPPLKIVGKNITKDEVTIPANISSQFITALILIAGKLENGLNINLDGEITSRPYLEMTLAILEKVGVKANFIGQTIRVFPKDSHKRINHYEVESDWSSASYYYSFSAISRKPIQLKSYKTLSLQGDSIIKEIYWKYFGINTVSDMAESRITLESSHNFEYPTEIILDMNNCPDIAQTLCVTASLLKIPFKITGLHTLKVKETDRLVALRNELQKIGAKTFITEDSIESISFQDVEEPIIIETYNDHRMAMAFAPVALIFDVEILDENVVEKSYPEFWEDYKKMTKD